MANLQYGTFSQAYKALIKSQTAERHGIDNTPPEEAKKNLKKLWSNIIKPLEMKLYPNRLIISSGFRCIKLNRLLKSKDSSQHPEGRAFDFECPPLSNHALFRFVKEHFQFDQLILEFYRKEKGPSSGWVHCSWKTMKGNRNHSFKL